MARSTFGGGAADFVFTTTAAGLVRAAAASLTFWDAETGGTQLTDLRLNGLTVSVIPVGKDGQIPTFQGPDGVAAMWADAGGGRVRVSSDALGNIDTALDATLPAKISTPGNPVHEELTATIGTGVADAYNIDAGAIATRPSIATPAFTIADPGGIRYPGWMSRDRSTIFNLSGVPTVNYSLDNGATWQGTTASLPAGVQGVRDLPDGEILVSSGNTNGKLFKSSGWSVNKTTATFNEVLAASGADIYFHNSWGMWVDHDTGIVLAAEYGSKVANANARYVYLSRDAGDTWETILDIGGAVDTHVHGVAYDKWWKRIWVSRGDTSTQIYYSDDLGQTWKTVNRKESTLKCQPTTIFPMAGCVLFLSDSPPNGVLRIRRQAKNDPLLEVAYKLNDSAAISHIGQLAFQADIPGAPVLLSFTNDPAGGAGSTGPGTLLATTDGFRFYDLWTDTIDYGAFGGLSACVGPTLDGKYIGTVVDGRQARYSRLTITAPTWAVPEAGRPNNALGDETLPRISAVAQPVMISGTLTLTYFTATETKLRTLLRAYTAGTAAANTATLFRLGLYKEDASGNLTLVAAGASDITKIQATYTSVAQTISARTVAGGRYAIGALCIGPGQMPTLAGVSAAAGTQLSSGALFLDPKVSAQVTGQTDLPATIAAGSLAASARVFWHAVT